MKLKPFMLKLEDAVLVIDDLGMPYQVVLDGFTFGLHLANEFVSDKDRSVLLFEEYTIDSADGEELLWLYIDEGSSVCIFENSIKDLEKLIKLAKRGEYDGKGE